MTGADYIKLIISLNIIGLSVVYVDYGCGLTCTVNPAAIMIFAVSFFICHLRYIDETHIVIN